MDIAFGPVPSRRLGSSLGINSIPPKTCSYGCVYCQVGPTMGTMAEPQPFFEPSRIREAVERRVEAVRAGGGTIDYLTFVPDGEPTLDSRLGAAIEELRPLDIPIAVISNGSLLWRPEVRRALGGADWVSVKVDAVDEGRWRRVNAPDRSLDLGPVLEGIEAFAAGFGGTLTSETMLVEGVNDAPGSVRAVASYVSRLGVATAYLAVPTRPPTAAWVRPPGEAALTAAYEAMAAVVGNVELLIGPEEGTFGSSGDARSDLLAIAAVHPMREPAVQELLSRSGADWSLVDELLATGELRSVEYRGERFLVHRVR